jgi:hypothetical protein
LKNPSPKKRAGGMVQGVDPEFKPQYRKKRLYTKRKSACNFFKKFILADTEKHENCTYL